MSTSARTTARKLPAKYRRQLLADNVIYKAIPAANDGHMKVLFGLWVNFFDPHGTNSMDCSYCLQNVLKSFKELQSEFLEMAREEALMNEV